MGINLNAFLGSPITLGDVQVVGPLTIAPLFGTPAPMRLLSLEEAIRDGAVARELPSAEVNRILVLNTTDHFLLLLDGEEVIGAQQNRIVDGTVIVAPGAERRVNVCCVEQGRWDSRRHNHAFAASPQMMSPALRATKSRTARGSGRGDQSSVWTEVERTLTQTCTHSATRSMTAVFDLYGAQYDELTASARCLEGQIGMIVGVGSRVWGIDLVADPRTFASMQRRLLRGYAVDAVNAQEPAALSRAELELTLRRVLDRPLGASVEGESETTHRFGGEGLSVEGTATVHAGELVALNALLPGAPQGTVALEERRVRTSETDPIDVAWLASPRGGLGVTFAPGKRGSSLSGRPWARDLEMDLVRLRGQHRVDALVGLLSDEELAQLGIEDYEERVTSTGFALHRLPLRDGRAPETTAEVQQLLAVVLPHLERGERVVVHCAGGLGRAGTVAGCALIELGLSAEEALEALRERHPRNCPENEAQRAFVRSYAA